MQLLRVEVNHGAYIRVPASDDIDLHDSAQRPATFPSLFLT